MTYEEAYEATKTMKPMSGMYITVSKGNPDSETSYYPDYKHHVSMGMAPMNLELRVRCIDTWDYFLPNLKEVNAGNPPQGRTQKQHNLIQSMNKKKRGW